MATDFRGLPGSYVGQAITPRQIFTTWAQNLVKFVPQLLTIDGTNSRDTGESPTSVLRAGLILGEETTSKKLRPSILGVLVSAAVSTATSLIVPAPVATEVARLITNNGSAVTLTLTGPPSSAGTVASFAVVASAASGTAVTVSSIGTAAAAGSILQPRDGSQTPLTILTSEFGIDVTDRNGNSIDQPLVSGLLIGADVITSNVINMTSDDFSHAVDPSVTAYLKAQLQTGGKTFTFSDDR